MKIKDWVKLGLQILGVIMVVVAVCVPYVIKSMEVMNAGGSEVIYIFDKSFTNPNTTDLTKTVLAFGIITLIGAVATLFLSLLYKFKIIKTKLPEIVLGALTIVCAIIAIATLGAYCSQTAAAIRLIYKNSFVMPHVGGYLLFVGGLLTGIPAVLKLKK